MIIPNKDGAGDTRLIPQSILSHFDYLRITASIEPCRFHELLQYCDGQYIGVEPDKPWSCGAGATYYSNKIVSPSGIVGGYTDNLETGKIDVMIDFSGQYFHSITVENTWRLLLGLKHSFKAKCNRIDLAVDDYTFDLIPVDKMVEASHQGNNFGFRKIKTIVEEEIGKSSSTTRYFGSRNSGKMVRVYNHKQRCLRYETEFKRNYSQAIFDFISSIERAWFDEHGGLDEDDIFDKTYRRQLSFLLKDNDVLVCPENLVKGLHGCKDKFDLILQRIISSIAVTAIDFRDKSSRKDRQRASRKDCPRMQFYQEFIDNVGTEIKIKSAPTKRCLSKTIAWVQRSVSKTISIVRDGIGAVEFQNWINELIEIGRYRQNNVNLKVVSMISNNPSIVRLNR